MQPLMMGETLLLMETKTRFEDLQVGDIISYRERVDVDDNWTNSSFVIRNYAPGSEPPAQEIEPKYKDEEIEYKPDKTLSIAL